MHLYYGAHPVLFLKETELDGFFFTIKQKRMPDRESNDYRWLTRFYFGVCNNRKRDIDPYNNLDDFLSAPVASLRWGDDQDSIRRSKFIFSGIFSRSLNEYGVSLDPYDINASLVDATSDTTNMDMVDRWFEQAQWS